ncbi:hypothetical protein Ark11_1160 [Candidatus Ichthyocystis hellenicum]|uniref:Uncharacterized protein n=1 Tax=Candidatus Ichthyocystis hellenicum TaxID=1561003 RepID=A0A0S4M2H4_9BURK|nr:hypothetical protein [Candidatus Ichthyocystis hellenicum]CUT17973.1 hypothetical protein Ark11_1160 [Candidatus Ichthyocystis hellenicum]
MDRSRLNSNNSTFQLGSVDETEPEGTGNSSAATTHPLAGEESTITETESLTSTDDTSYSLSICSTSTDTSTSASTSTSNSIYSTTSCPDLSALNYQDISHIGHKNVTFSCPNLGSIYEQRTRSRAETIDIGAPFFMGKIVDIPLSQHSKVPYDKHMVLPVPEGLVEKPSYKFNQRFTAGSRIVPHTVTSRRKEVIYEHVNVRIAPTLREASLLNSKKNKKKSIRERVLKFFNKQSVNKDKNQCSSSKEIAPKPDRHKNFTPPPRVHYYEKIDDYAIAPKPDRHSKINPTSGSANYEEMVNTKSQESYSTQESANYEAMVDTKSQESYSTQESANYEAMVDTKSQESSSPQGRSAYEPVAYKPVSDTTDSVKLRSTGARPKEYKQGHSQNPASKKDRYLSLTPLGDIGPDEVDSYRSLRTPKKSSSPEEQSAGAEKRNSVFYGSLRAPKKSSSPEGQSAGAEKRNSAFYGSLRTSKTSGSSHKHSEDTTSTRRKKDNKYYVDQRTSSPEQEYEQSRNRTDSAGSRRSGNETYYYSGSDKPYLLPENTLRRKDSKHSDRARTSPEQYYEPLKVVGKIDNWMIVGESIRIRGHNEFIINTRRSSNDNKYSALSNQVSSHASPFLTKIEAVMRKSSGLSTLGKYSDDLLIPAVLFIVRSALEEMKSDVNNFVKSIYSKLLTLDPDAIKKLIEENKLVSHIEGKFLSELRSKFKTERDRLLKLHYEKNKISLTDIIKQAVERTSYGMEPEELRERIEVMTGLVANVVSASIGTSDLAKLVIRNAAEKLKDFLESN